MASGSAFAQDYIEQYPVDSNWQLTVEASTNPGSAWGNFTLSSASQPQDNTDAVIDLTFTDDLYAKVNAMNETMGKWGSLNEGKNEDYWSTVSGLHFYGTDSATYATLDLDLTAKTTDASEGSYDLVGLYLAGVGDLTVGAAEGEPEGTTNITVTGNYDVPVSTHNPVATVIGLMAEADGPIQNEQEIVTFNTRTTNIKASATGKNLIPVGLYMRNGSHEPVIEFNGNETTIAAASTAGNAIGVFVQQDDLTDDPNPVSGILGLKSTTTTITAEASKAIGLWALGDNTVNVGGDLKVTVQGDNYALWFGSDAEARSESSGLADAFRDIMNTWSWSRPQLGKTTFRVLEGASATLNGRVHFDKSAAILLGGDMTVNGKFTLLGTIDGVEGADSKTVLGNLTLTQGGTIGAATGAGSLDLTANLAKLAVSGDLTAQNATINADEFTLENGTLDNLSAEINGTKATLGDGAKLVNKGGFHYDTIVLGAGSTYLEEEDEFFDAEGNLGIELAADEGTLEFAGGKLGAIGAESKALTQIRFADEAPNQSSNSDLTLVRFSANSSYALDDVTFAQTKEDRLSGLEVTDGAKLAVKSFTAGNGKAFVKQGGALSIDKLTSTGNFAMTVRDTGLLTIDEFVGSEGSHFTLAEGAANIGTLDLTKGVLEVGSKGKLSTTTGEVFTIALNADGTNIAEANALKYSTDSLVFAEGGKLALTDAKFNKGYADTATDVFTTAYKGGAITFTGTLVDASGNVEESVDIGDVNDGQIFEKTDVTAKADETGKVEVDKSFGGRTLQLGKGVASVDVTNGNTLTLVGSAEGGELVAYEGDKAPALNVAGGLALGSETADVKGSISAAIDLSGKDGLTVKNGSFTLADVTVSGETKLDAGKAGKLDVTSLKLANNVDVLGNVNVGTLTVSQAADLSVESGNLTVAKGSLKNVAVTVGAQAAAAYAAADETPAASSTDATTFAFGGKTVDGSISANANGVVAIGTTDLTAFHAVFSEEFGTWSAGTAAAFVAGPVTVEKTGSLLVGAAAGTNAQVAFGKDSVLVADITGMTAEDTLITADSFDVAKESVAYLVGSVKDGVATYKLTSDTNPDAKYWNSKETLKSGSAMLEVAFDDKGNWTVANVNAPEAYGNLMQGHALADAGYRSQGAERDYAQALLTDTTGLSNAAVAARFDAAMNPGGSLAVFTTAYDRASDLRRVVRDEAAAASTESRLWARVTGGMTKLDGISTGAQALNVETDAYGLAVGAESMLGDWKLGGAFTAGTGDTDNDDVAAKDEFDFYGLSFYGKKSIGAYDVLFDATAAWVKSDLKVNGVADLTTDTTTSVYGLGAEVRRTADLGAVKLTPFVGANLYYVTSDGYTTNHGVRVDDADATAVEFPIGAELSAAFDTAGGMRLLPAFSLAVVPTAGDTEVDQTVAFAGATSSYRFTFADDVKVRSNLALTAEAGDFAFGLKAGYEWGDGERGATTFSLNAAYRF
ncbi:autotransporter outer membrane beta-barrel domain-containing protein [Sutterella megalosphaeroides]|uniref:Autotransporter domain-containing protein n=1 Tax=Sutterella megalosphaeroides TaxID=2494234 RepID=A0A2Z6IC10_9BURK|nr:autotransporter outer membrane beta-barrel domain-containing protein [Sutterella megalosphaeroides]BBF23832.1 hypothetical protein SUTMEG_17230 [Sutterella megalosphaeroides]